MIVLSNTPLDSNKNKGKNMSQYLSPGVYVTEQDYSAIVPNVASNVAFFAGEFTKGPAGIPFAVTNKQELIDNFGTPTDQNYNQWFQCYKFLDYGDQLVITRAFVETNTDPLNDPTPSDNPEYVADYENYQESGSLASFTIIQGLNKYSWELPQFQEGDWISFGDAGQDPNNIAVVSTFKYVNSGPGITSCEIEVTAAFSGSTVPNPDVEGKIYLHSKNHKNGETEAFYRGPVDSNDNPTIPMAVDPENVDFIPDPDTQCYSDNRLNTTYDTIKNDTEWDFYYTAETNRLRHFKDKSKLKFFSKTPSKEVIEIAIANYYDFITEYDSDGSPYNNAIAFTSKNGDEFENYYLTDLYHYYPNSDQVAIMIKMGDKLETYIVAFDPEGVDGNNRSNYIETVINEQSELVYVLENSSISDLPASYLVCDRMGYDESGAILGVETMNLKVQGGKNPKVDVGAIRDAYFTAEDKERYEIDVIIGNEVVYDGGDNLNIAIELADKRKDCIAYVGARYVDTVGKSANDATNAIVKYLTQGYGGLTRTMFGAFFGNYFRIYDPYNKKYRWINVAGDMAGIRCSVSNDNAAWWVSAGMKRGIIRGIDRMAFIPSKPQRDTLYKNSINPLVRFPGTGDLVWGNKTLLPYASSFDRINIRTLFNELEKAMSKAARSQVFEFNDPYTRNSILAMFNPYLSSIKAGRGITDFLVVCDETNNTPDVISRNELKVDIYIRHTYVAEFIHLNFVNVGSRSIAEIVSS